ncbi:alkaline phosphatase [Salipaludibacillus agaradhaerens]|uniref:alkaline phosphatase n=1 Tax=Salipaludibacillus agaradhaerens TaxID=76935 RepID=UPI0021518224|nr:alkaline phosphatase [Salipaludibacillus agaradhaerens]MCR6105476.1 alkaline phosphatase [Salipaludibacillus agaradhaerens]MCR6117514.1 alkaline phosphatase [Salipaludibacillus agaradhaerens]
MLKKLFVSGLSVMTLLVGTGAMAEGEKPDPPSKNEVDNVILFIADGYSAGYNVNYRYYKEDGDPVWDSFLTGMMTTHSANNRITDSAAAGTAMSTGMKTKNGFIGLNEESEKVQTILEAAHESEKATGLVATSTITHATPAAFASHVDSRNNQTEIARQYVDNGTVDVLLGGGKDYFLPESEGGHQETRHLLNEAKDEGYEFVENKDELLNANSNQILGLFANDSLEPELHREGTEQPSLADMTSSAIEALSQDEDGFFLMVEGSQIDWAGHANDAAWAMSDTAAFEEAVMQALKFAEEDEQTLVIVTSDHDTGGMTLGGYHSHGTDVEILREVTATGEHMATQLNGDRSNVEEVIEAYTSLTLSDEEIVTIEEADDLELAINHTISQYAGVGWTTTNHTGIEVPVYAYGKGTEHFQGLIDNTDLAKNIATVLNIPF